LLTALLLALVVFSKSFSLLGTAVTDCAVGHFNDGEISVQIKESVRGKDVYIVLASSSK
jgi:phosphoribosylpyrophosphate synthetase